MSKQHFFVRLIPPRATFPMDMTPEQRVLMQEHARYTREGFDAGKILVYGPVMAPAGAFGMAVFESSDEAEVRLFLENDPTVRAGLNSFEIHPMRLGAAQGSDAEAQK
jgi:uncharacterized protein YciI